MKMKDGVCRQIQKGCCNSKQLTAQTSLGCTRNRGFGKIQISGKA